MSDIKRLGRVCKIRIQAKMHESEAGFSKIFGEYREYLPKILGNPDRFHAFAAGLLFCKHGLMFSEKQSIKKYNLISTY